jgi:c-di-GMP-binding flagellar brake protein YcgR
MHRLQRRETFRVKTPRVNGPLCNVTDPVSGKSHLLSVYDISAGGIGLLQRQGAPGLTIAQRYPNSCLAMPALGEIEVAITVRYRMEFTSPKGERCARYGASFEDVLPGVRDQVLRYIYFLLINFSK